MGTKKKLARLKRAKRSRAKMSILGTPRLCVFRSPRHIYVQLISSAGNEVKASASSLDPSVRKENKGNATDAQKVGQHQGAITSILSYLSSTSLALFPKLLKRRRSSYYQVRNNRS